MSEVIQQINQKIINGTKMETGTIRQHIICSSYSEIFSRSSKRASSQRHTPVGFFFQDLPLKAF